MMTTQRRSCVSFPSPAELLGDPQLASLAVLDVALQAAAAAVTAEHYDIDELDLPIADKYPPDPPLLLAALLLEQIDSFSSLLRRYAASLRTAASLAAKDFPF